MDLTPEAIGAIGAVVGSGLAGVLAIIREVRKTNPNGALTTVEKRLRELEGAVSDLKDALLRHLSGHDSKDSDDEAA